MVSDNGSGFRQSETIYFYSMWQELYGKKFRPMQEQYPPWHAFSMADSMGGRLAHEFEEEKCSGDLETPGDYVAVGRSSEIENAEFFEHTYPGERGKEILPPMRKHEGIRKLHSFQYHQLLTFLN